MPDMDVVRTQQIIRLTSLLLLIALASCGRGGVLDPQGPVSGSERMILFNATAIMLVVVAPVIVLTLAFAWWYRASNTRATYTPHWEYSGQIELTVWSIPLMVIILVGGVAWIGSHELDPRAPLASDQKPLAVQAVSMDWKWLFILPGRQVASVNELTVPVGVPLELQLTSSTVMSAFFVPQLGSMIYTMPGMTTHLNLMADKAGDYPGLASHYSGGGFSDMHFVVHAVPQAAFDSWIAHARADGQALDISALTRAAKADPAIYRDVPDDAFDHILDAAVNPAMQHPGVN